MLPTILRIAVGVGVLFGVYWALSTAVWSITIAFLLLGILIEVSFIREAIRSVADENRSNLANMKEFIEK